MDGLTALANSEATEPVNIGNPHEQTLLELAELIIAMCGSSSRIEFLPRPTDDPERRRPDISRARAELGWEPRVEVEEGLRETIDYFRGIGHD